MSYIYLPNGYMDISQSIRIGQGIWSSDYPPVQAYWQMIVDSGRGYLVNKEGAIAQDSPIRVIEQAPMASILRKQYEVLLGYRLRETLSVTDLITRILALQVPEKTVADLRAEYKEVVGKRPFNGWDKDTLQQKINEYQNG